MSVSSVTNRATYNGDGTTVAFAFPYYFTAQTDLNVLLFDPVLGKITPFVLNSDYTVTGSPNYQGIYSSGGGISCAVAPASGKIIVIYRDPSRVQNFALAQNGLLSSTALVQQLDYLTLLVQRLEDQITRAPLLPDGMGSAFSMTLPSTITLSPGNSIIVNQLGTGLDIGPASWQKIVVPYTSLQTAALSTSVTAFALPKNSILTGLVLKHSTAFVGTSITALSFDVGLGADQNKFLAAFDGLQVVGDTAWDSLVPNYIGSFVTSTNVIIKATATGANLSALTAGSITLFYQYFNLGSLT